MELTGQKWANIKHGSSIFGKALISLRRLPFGVNVMLNLSIVLVFNVASRPCVAQKIALVLMIASLGEIVIWFTKPHLF